MSANKTDSDQIQVLMQMAVATPLTGARTTTGSIAFEHPNLPPALVVVWYRHQFDAAFSCIGEDHVFEIKDLNGDCINIDPSIVVDHLLDHLPTLANRIKRQNTNASLMPIATILDARNTASQKSVVPPHIEAANDFRKELFYGHIYGEWCKVRRHWIELELEVLSDLGADASEIPEGAIVQDRPGVAEALEWVNATTVQDLFKDPWWIDHATTLLYEPRHTIPDHLYDLLTELGRVFVGTQNEPDAVSRMWVVSVAAIVRYLNDRHRISGSQARKMPISDLLVILRKDEEPYGPLANQTGESQEQDSESSTQNQAKRHPDKAVASTTNVAGKKGGRPTLKPEEKEWRKLFLDGRRKQEKEWRDIEGVTSNQWFGFIEFLESADGKEHFKGVTEDKKKWLQGIVDLSLRSSTQAIDKLKAEKSKVARRN